MDKISRDIYREEILEQYRHPHNFGAIKKPTHAGSASNSLCGDSILLELRVNHQGIVEDVGFRGSGCALSIASASIFTEWLRGKKFSELRKLKSERLLKLIGIPVMPTRQQCVLLPHAALLKMF